MMTPAPVQIKAVDTDDLRDVEDVAEAIEFSVVLSNTPTEAWWAEFEGAYNSLSHTIKPQTRLEGDRIWITYLPRYEGELQQYITFLAEVVRVANAEEQLTYDLHLKGHRSGPREQFRKHLLAVKLPKSTK